MAHPESRPPFVEEEAVHRALFLAEHAGVRVQIVHGSSPVSVDLVTEARRRGAPATIEVCPHHLLLDMDDYRRLGPWGCCAPALRERELVRRNVGQGVARRGPQPGVRPRRVHARGEGAWPRGHARMPARVPGHPGDRAAGAVRGDSSARHVAAGVRALQRHELRQGRRAVSAEGDDPARRRRRPRALRPAGGVDRGSARAAVLEESLVSVRGTDACAARWCARSFAAGPSTATARSPRRRATASFCPARTSIVSSRSRVPARGDGSVSALPACTDQPQHQPSAHRRDGRRRRRPSCPTAPR